MTHFTKATVLACAFAGIAGLAMAQDLAPLNSDEEPDRIDWSQLENEFGPVPAPPEGTKVGGVSKTLTNEYWRSLGEGYKNVADKYGMGFAYQAAPSEGYVGNVQRDNGVRVAQWFIEHHPEGGKVAVIEGQPGVYAAAQRTDGFTTTIEAAGGFEVVASVPANWSRETAYNAAATILQQHPDLIGFYANNDGMALGVIEAVKAADKAKQTAVFGTDGISDAYTSIRNGDLTGTVDSFPVLTGEVAMDVVLRLMGGQDLPRVVATPQALITSENVDAYSTDDIDQLRATLTAQE